MTHLAPVLDIIPRVIAARSGDTITAMVAPDGREHLVWAITRLPGTPLATVTHRTPALLEEAVARLAAPQHGLRRPQ